MASCTGLEHIISRCHRSRGFTLMEVLVSITLMSVLSVAVHYGYRIGLDSWSRAEKSMEKERKVQSVLDLMSRQLGSMVPYYSRQPLDGAPVDVLLFNGTSQGVRFVSTFSAGARNAGGLRLVEYFVDNTSDGGVSLLMNDRLLPEATILGQTVIRGVSRGEGNSVVAEFEGFSPRPDSEILVQDLSSVQFRFPRRPKREEGEAAESVASDEVGLMLPGDLGFLMRAAKQRSGVSAATNKKESLPLGVELRLKWQRSGILNAEELCVSVPVQASF
jgi:prepilin-type N-terminal cleavage/methylation domain-containing protein